MSAFGKYGTGGLIKGNYKAGSDEGSLDTAAALEGTTDRQPNTKPEISADKVNPGSHNG